MLARTAWDWGEPGGSLQSRLEAAPSEQVVEALDAARAIIDERYRAEVLTGLAPHLAVHCEHGPRTRGARRSVSN